MGLKNTWPKIIGSKKLDQIHNKNNRHRGNLRDKF